jgi:hypothetical protein
MRITLGSDHAGLCHDTYSAGQGVEHGDMNVLVLGVCGSRDWPGFDTGAGPRLPECQVLRRRATPSSPGEDQGARVSFGLERWKVRMNHGDD